MPNPYVNIEWGVGRAQFAVAWPEIKAHMDARLSLKSMYRKLSDAGRIKMTYRRFCQLYVEKMRSIQAEITKTTTEERHVEKKTTSAPSAQTATQAPPVQRTGPKIITPQKPKPFGQSNITDYRDVI